MAYKYSKGARELGDIEYEGDPDETQIDFEDDFIALKTAGNQVLVVSGSDVGIGISTPTQNLHVVGSGNTTLRVQGSDGYYGALNVKGGTGDSAWVWQPADTSELRFFTVDDDRIVILGTGEVGIGTSAPAYNLHVASDSSAIVFIDGAAGTDSILRFGQAGTLKSYIKQGSGGNLVITNQTSDRDIILNIKDDTTEREGLRLNGNVAEVVVNEGSQSLMDFRVESNANTHMLFVDGSTDSVGVDTSTPGSGFAVNSSFSLKVAGPKTSVYTIAEDDSCIVADCNASAFALTLPSATDAMAGRIYTLKRMDSGASGGGNMLTISRNGKNIDNVAGDVLLANLEALVLQCIGADGGWIRIGSFMAPM